ncbi:hypothetical protein JGI1_00640 [Candidatus Thermokryptus mobilis]|uniref:Carbonic anhydrase n=1 Tax=Candidatus Thermokryptus mobilis TaxID=1643428 RepID=A0A0S4MZK4_9BACT|nr:carbonic anhydrase [Candidatus Thermokryptus mobilis]CUU02973.1 hypothetical protein JGI1_00640 [Candidatus Thermokryptus mobilis]
MPKFITCINCIDGRTQLPVIEFLKQKYDADFVDLITFPGADGVLARGESKAVEMIKKNVETSVRAHSSNLIAIVGHFDCAGNPVDEKTHIENIKSCVEKISSWGLGLEVIGLWVDSSWDVVQVK